MLTSKFILNILFPVQCSFQNYLDTFGICVCVFWIQCWLNQLFVQENSFGKAERKTFTRRTQETTAIQTTAEQTTASWTTADQTTASWTTAEQTTASWTTPEQTTASWTTAEQTTASWTTAEQTSRSSISFGSKQRYFWIKNYLNSSYVQIRFSLHMKIVHTKKLHHLTNFIMNIWILKPPFLTLRNKQHFFF